MDVFHKGANGVKVTRMDDVGEGGMYHRYAITSKNCKGLFGAVDFQRGSVEEERLNGCGEEELLVVVIDRLERLQEGGGGCDQDHFALGFVKKALDCLERRRADRDEAVAKAGVAVEVGDGGLTDG